ncbi:MAG: winged helix-turn-helix domain-containing protein, partial [Brevibacterium aurantiacum]|nr:winged helix-turn-helix domain-containing protein [Brevibacterium aurantiacum]
MYRFGAFTLDPERYELLRDGLLVHVEPQVFDLLCFLIEHRDRVVGKDEILVAVWGDRFVSESALTSRIKSARRAVGDSGDTQHLIRTARQRGYQFVAVVSTIDRPATQQTPGIESASQGAAVPAGMKPSTSAFRIQLLGSFGVASDGLPDDTRQWRLRKAKALVAMLALAPGQRRHREYVLDRLWPDLEPLAAAKNLHQTLYVARHAITGAEVLPSGLLSICDDHVVLEETGPVDVDVLRFERAAANALKSCVEAELRGADALYGGDLLPDWVDSDWLTDRRHALRETHREISVKLAETLLSHAPDEALLILTRVLESSPVHEGAVRAQMRVLARMGRRSEALARYENLVDDLLEAFGTDPDGQTVALFRQLLTGAPAAPAFPRAPSGGAEAGIGYLPAPLTSFIGRERELDDVERLMSHARLLTLTGAGGSGKTRLALEVGRTAAADYPDGVWFVDLSTVGESLLVADAVAETLRLDSGAAPNRQKALVDSLRSRTLLIVLDNCEHLLAACRELVTSVLAGCPEVNVLATSREPLHAHGEYTFRVPSLALPSPSSHTIPDLHEIGDLSSVRLFVERATQVRPDFTLDSSNVEGVIEVCRQLDGMPLPLELA